MLIVKLGIEMSLGVFGPLKGYTYTLQSKIFYCSTNNKKKQSVNKLVYLYTIIKHYNV